MGVLTMAKGVSHRIQIEQLRDHLREERRKAVRKLGAKATARNFTLTRFITLQRAFEAAERAIRDEIVEESHRTAEAAKDPQPPKGYSYSPPELEDT
jgi:hypothetical protein